MENKNSFKLLNVVLLESLFKREAHINYDAQGFDNKISINLDSKQQENNLQIFLTVIFSSGVEEKSDIVAEVKMLGIFEIHDNNIPTDVLSKINGPAIIFPFIREHIASCSLKAGVRPIFLPPVNFVELVREEQNK